MEVSRHGFNTTDMPMACLMCQQLSPTLMIPLNTGLECPRDIANVALPKWSSSPHLAFLSKWQLSCTILYPLHQQICWLYLGNRSIKGLTHSPAITQWLCTIRTCCWSCWGLTLPNNMPIAALCDWAYQPASCLGGQHSLCHAHSNSSPATVEGHMQPTQGRPMEYLAWVTMGEHAAGFCKISPTKDHIPWLEDVADLPTI